MYTREQVAAITDPDPERDIDLAQRIGPARTGRDAIMAGLAVAYAENAFRTDIGRNEDKPHHIERAAMRLNWERETDEMVNIHNVFSGDYVKAADLGGGDRKVGITAVEVKEFDDGNKLVLHFHRTDKCLVCNKTNASMIAAMHGDDTDGWVGKVITLYPTKVEFAGKVVDAIRVRYDQPAIGAQTGNGTFGEPAQQQAPTDRLIGGMGAQDPGTFGQGTATDFPQTDDTEILF